MPTVEKKGGGNSRSRARKTEGPPVGGEDILVTYWKRRLTAAEKKLKSKGGDQKSGEWKSLIDFFEGKQWDENRLGNKGRWHRVTANQIKGAVDSIRPQIYFKNPTVKISLKNPTVAPEPIPEMEPMMDPMTGQQAMNPQTMRPMMQPVMDPQTRQPKIKIPAGTPIAKVGGQIVDAQVQTELWQAIDNYYLKEVDARKKIRRAINDALVVPYGALKWEWKTEYQESQEQDPNDPSQTVTSSQVTKKYPCLSRVKPWMLLWDVELDEFDLSQAAWVAEIKYLSKQDIEDDDNMKVDFDEIPDTALSVSEDYETDSKSKEPIPDDCKRYTVYEIHDLKNDELVVWVLGSKKLARRESPSPYSAVEGSVYTLLGFDEAIADSFPQPVTKGIKSQQEAYNWVMSYAVNHVARGNRKYKAMQGTFVDPAEREKWEAGADNTTVEVTTMSGGPEPINETTINPDVYNVGNILRGEIRDSLGVSAMDQSRSEPGVDTAYEASQIQTASNVKLDEKREIVKEFMVDLVRKLNQILQAHADVPQIIQIAGEDAGQKWVKWSRDDIQGEFILDVDIHSAAPYSELEDRKQAMEMFSIIQQDPYFDPRKVRLKLVKMMGWDADLLKSEQQLQQEAAQAQQQAEEQQKQAQMQEMAKQQSRTLRPSGGEVRRRPDVVAAIRGGARRA